MRRPRSVVLRDRGRHDGRWTRRAFARLAVYGTITGAIVNTRELLRWVWPTPASPVIKQIGPPQLAGEVQPAGSLSLQVIRSR